MRFVLVFPDPYTLQLAHRIRTTERHRVTAVAGLPPTGLSVNDRAWPTVPLSQVLTLREVDAVIVGRAVADTSAEEEVRLAFIRTCVQAELPLLISHPIGDLNVGYELQLAQSHNGLVILPFVSGLWHPGWRRVVQALDRDPAGTTDPAAARTVEVQREYPSIAKPRIRRDFATDALILRLLLGPMQRINCFCQENPADESVTGINVQMSDLSGRLVRWTAGIGKTDRAALRLWGDENPMSVEFCGDPDQWTWRTGPVTTPPIALEQHPDIDLLDYFDDAVNVPSVGSSPTWPFPSSTPPGELWAYACRALEVADTMERSARRGRTLELSDEEQSESSTFKSFMAAGGCLALTATVTLGLFLIAVDRFQNRTGTFAVTGQWPWLILLVVLVVFLAMQVLKFVIPDND